MTKAFDVPVCLFTWQRWDTVSKIISVLEKIKPAKLYLFSDGGRNDKEWENVHQVRSNLKKAINWKCNVTYKFAESNIGVFKTIGLGALSVFEHEKSCIFLEDDNLPTESFFYYCKECLEKYELNENVFLICGTNYLKNGFKTSYSYMFVQALLPCGWASWSNKFCKYYDTTLEYFDKEENRKEYLKKYQSRNLAIQQLNSISAERNRFINTGEFRSWDYHLIGSIMRNDLLVISPKYNQITNIGVDELGVHNSKKFKKNRMTKRFCEVKRKELELPLVHPNSISIDYKYQKCCDRIITLPISLRFKGFIGRILKKCKIIK